MNDRIQELAQEVFSFKYKLNPNELNPDHNMDHIHKFAELIVRECAKWVNDNVGLLDEEAETDLLKHFGVEE